MVSQLGNSIIDHFNESSRGLNIGKNDEGVEISHIILSLEQNGFDSSVLSSGNNNGFTHRGLDSASDRTTDLRAGFSFYRGVESTPPPSSLGFAQRRRIVVIDHTDASNPIIRHNDLPLSSGDLGNNNINLIRAAINNASLAPAGLTYEAWAAAQGLAEGSNSPTDDPDKDGAVNLLEFSAGTNPSLRSSAPLYTLKRHPDGFAFTYPALRDAVEINRIPEAGPLDNFTALTDFSEMVTRDDIDDDREMVTIQLPPDAGPFFRLKVEFH